jgi:hypothetical protein
MIVGEDLNTDQGKAIRAFVKGDLSPPKPSQRKATKKRAVHQRGKEVSLAMDKRK